MVAPLKPWVMKLKSSQAWFFSRPTWNISSQVSRTAVSSCQIHFSAKRRSWAGKGCPLRHEGLISGAQGRSTPPQGSTFSPIGGGTLGWIVTLTLCSWGVKEILSKHRDVPTNTVAGGTNLGGQAFLESCTKWYSSLCMKLPRIY